MDPSENYEHLLQDLALVYVALAHGIDHDLSSSELDAIAHQLRKWQSLAGSEHLLHSIKVALRGYVEAIDQHQATVRFNEAITRLGDKLSVEQRGEVIDDLMAIAVADDKVLHEEVQFVTQIARGWNVPMSYASEQHWSILEAKPSPEGWTPAHDLALLYLVVAHQPDQHIADRELEAILKKVKEWLPDATSGYVMRILREALEQYAADPDETIVTRAIEGVRQVVPVHQHAALLADLRYVADADGVMLVEERTLINRLAESLGLSSTDQS